MTYGISRREELEYIKIMAIVSAIVTAGRVAAGADAGDSLQNALKELRSAMFPEIKAGLLEKAEKNLKLLEQEYQKGPMKVKAREYSTKRRRKR